MSVFGKVRSGFLDWRWLASLTGLLMICSLLSAQFVAIPGQARVRESLADQVQLDIDQGDQRLCIAKLTGAALQNLSDFIDIIISYGNEETAAARTPEEVAAITARYVQVQARAVQSRDDLEHLEDRCPTPKPKES